MATCRLISINTDTDNSIISYLKELIYLYEHRYIATIKFFNNKNGCADCQTQQWLHDSNSRIGYLEGIHTKKVDLIFHLSKIFDLILVLIKPVKAWRSQASSC
jgi:hypothetical protein